MNNELANRLINFRKSFGYSRKELAKKVGVSPQTIYSWEKGEESPDADNLIKLSEAYGVSIDELIKGKKESGDIIKQTAPEPETPHEKEEDDDESRYDKKGRAYTIDKDGNIVIDRDVRGMSDKAKHIADRIPVWALALAAMFVWGFSGKAFGFALSWICLFAIPLYHSLIHAIYKKNPDHFAYPVLCIAEYIVAGFFGIFGGWAFGWLVFLTVPIYYCVTALFERK